MVIMIVLVAMIIIILAMIIMIMMMISISTINNMGSGNLPSRKGAVKNIAIIHSYPSAVDLV